jgi:hypothetical protein
MKKRALLMKIKIISKENNIQNKNPIERSFAKVLTYGFTEKSNMSEVAKNVLNASLKVID